MEGLARDSCHFYWVRTGPSSFTIPENLRRSKRSGRRLTNLRRLDHSLRLAPALALIVLALPSEAAAQQAGRPGPGTGEPDSDDHAIVFEIGAAADWSRSEPVRPGGTFAVEVTPIEHWLELETGVTVIRADHSTETSIDLLFKKPWRVSRTFEFMAGAGPEIVHATGTGGATFGGLSAVADFMIWPRTNIGWYVEPGYEVTFRDGGTRHGLGIAVGLIVGR